jgi:hypothetical protein
MQRVEGVTLGGPARRHERGSSFSGSINRRCSLPCSPTMASSSLSCPRTAEVQPPTSVVTLFTAMSLALQRRAAYPTQSSLANGQIHGPALSLRQSEPVSAHTSATSSPAYNLPKRLKALTDLTAFQFILAQRTRQICTYGPRNELLVDKDSRCGLHFLF